jgi:putative ABC transport system permease protein
MKNNNLFSTFFIKIKTNSNAGNKWLQSFPYRATQGWWLFAGAGMLVVFIALITVSVQAFKAAIANPVKSLRTE